MRRTAGYREAIDLTGRWQFIPDPDGRVARPQDLAVGTGIDVPSCWEAQSEEFRGIVTAWYRRTVDIPADWRDSRLVIAFGAVMYHATVFFNGRRLGEHEGGYTPFELEAADAIGWGGPNEIAVRVVNPLGGLRTYPASAGDIAAADERTPEFLASEIPHGKQTWYSSQSGIWQSVRVERRPRPALTPLRVRVELADPAAWVRWGLELDGVEPDGASRLSPLGPAGQPTATAADSSAIAVELTILDPDGKAVSKVTVDPAGATNGEVRMAIDQPRLWDIGQPNLYRAEARLVSDGVVRDVLDARFGMREIGTRDGRILLNGRPIYLIGALDHDLYAETISTPPSRAMLDDQISRVRELGLNLLRCHIKVPDPAYLDAADEAGILVWCELPNWQTFTAAAARRGRETLRAMVHTLGNHPSIIIWTIINEDWGTRVQEEARDRAWLADTYAWLKSLDPDRLVVDNSACDTPTTPNFHVRSDLADFHVYYGAPDNAARWRQRIADFAKRPTWLWSPFGDAQSRGDEPLVLSEFGSWGLPRLGQLEPPDGRSPWWFETGNGHLRPAGIRQRFREFGLDRIWPTLDDLAEATQWHQFEALQSEIGVLRRHDVIQGYVITELSDAYWEANGLLDVDRGKKAFHHRSASINAPDVVVVDIQRRDLCPGDVLAATIHLSSYGGPFAGGEIQWELEGAEGPSLSGRVTIETWPDGGARPIGELEISLPRSMVAGDGQLIVRAVDGTGRVRATDAIRLAILPIESSRTRESRAVNVDDQIEGMGVAERVAGLGHRLADRDAADLVVASELGEDVTRHVESGGRALILVRSRSAIRPDHRLSRPVTIRGRALPDPSSADARSPWDGNWVTSWSWILPGAVANLPIRNPLDFAYREVLPDHVLDGYDPQRDRDEVIAGMFSGWVHAPAALVWRFPQGNGQVTLTTFRVAPERGPLATVLLEGLIQLASVQAEPGGSSR
jgi:Glycosyl hydrolases family 2, sugar binding domain/Glycosyl hydrolases family 2, TIM barrel domain/Glycosyl hydrolases family 2